MNVAAMLALVFAMSGGAIAATGGFPSTTFPASRESYVDAGFYIVFN